MGGRLGAHRTARKHCLALTTRRSRRLTVPWHGAGMSFAKLFRSRWSALLWAGGVLWTAYDVAAGSPPRTAPANTAAPAPEDATGTPYSNDDLATLANIAGDEN